MMINGGNVHLLLVSVMLVAVVPVTANSHFRSSFMRYVSFVPYPTLPRCEKAKTQDICNKIELQATVESDPTTVNQQSHLTEKTKSRMLDKTAVSYWDTETFDECASLWKLSCEEQTKMRILETKLKDIQHWKNDPFEVVRFLREFNGNVDVAENKFRKMISWRIENNVDTILECYTPPHGFDYFPIAVLKGVDRDGDPIHVERTGASDMLDLLKRYGESEMMQHAIWIREQDTRGVWQREHESKQGRRIHKFTVILDMHGFNRKHFSPALLPVGRQVSRFVQDNYPSYTKKIIVIRAPPVFHLAWSAFKPFVDKQTRDLIVFSTASDYRDVLSRYVDPKVLPPIIFPDGEGEAATGFHPVWEGGSPPKVVEPFQKAESAHDPAGTDYSTIPMSCLMPPC